MTAQRLLLAGLLTLAPLGFAHADAANGQKLARTVCVNCHIVAPGVGPAQVTAGVPSFMAVANKPGQNGSKIKGFVLNPHPPMPQVQLTKRELDDIAAYILSLKDKQ